MASEKLHIDTIHFGELIRETLQNTNLSTRFLASEMGYTDVHLYRIFHKEDVNTEILRKVCRVTNTELSTLLTGAMSGNHINLGNTNYPNNHVSSEGGGFVQNNGASNQDSDRLLAKIELLNLKISSLETKLELKETIINMKDEIISMYKVNSK